MNNRNKLTYLIPIMGIITIFFSCENNKDTDPLFTLESRTIELGNTPQDVYFIFTNPSTTDESPVIPSISSRSESRNILDKTKPYLDDSFYFDSQLTDNGIENKIQNFQKVFNKESKSTARTSSTSPLPEYIPKEDDKVLDTTTFYLDKEAEGESIEATCRYAEQIDNIKLFIWVADNCWEEAGNKTNLINQKMVNSLAMKFLTEDDDNDVDDDNDIYDWVTAIYGQPWGENADLEQELLPSSEANRITILLQDIDNDNSTDGGTLGYFWSKNNFRKEVCSGSNERIMFSLDAVMYATKDEESDNVWSINDYWPDTLFNTLGHEFQHMIHFYQKTISYNTDYSDTWLNEMCSEVTSDLIAEKRDSTGPRGYKGEYSGYPWIKKGRLPLFNVCNDDSLTVWDDNGIDYSTVYGFGSFLARNYGGASLFKEIVQNNYIDEQAIIDALETLGYSKTFQELLIEWGEAVLSSEKNRFGYNKMDSSLDYTIYPINLNYYAYDFESWTLSEPKIYNGNISNIMPSENLPPTSNTYYRAGYNLTGTQSWDVEIPKGTILTIVQKDSK